MKRFTFITIILTLLASCQESKTYTYSGTTVNGDGQSVLYNGITLPDVWPPRLEVPLERKEMPLPYIDNKPCPIIINTGRQLFVDDFLIEENSLQRVCHHANAYEGNPLLDEITYSDGVWYDERAGKFRIWYYGKMMTAYAESEDGMHWSLDTLGIYPNSNEVDAYHGDSHIVWWNKEEKDPDKRFKSICTCSKINSGYILQYSADGIHWSEPRCLTDRVQDRSTAFYNNFTKKWVMSERICALIPPSRSRAYCEADSVEQALSQVRWVQDELDNVINDSLEHYVMKDEHNLFWFTADDKDERHPWPEFAWTQPAIYNFDAIAYESVMLGQYAMWRGPENHIMSKAGVWKLNEVGLGYSRDGFHFYRPDHSAFIGCNHRDTTAWNGGNMQACATNPVIVGDSLYFYVGAHPQKLKTKNGRGWTGLYTLRRDGFVSMDCKEESTLTTVPVSFDGKYFFVNAKAANLAVEVLDKEGNVIRGFSKEDCIAMKDGDSTKYRITWKHKKTLSGLCDTSVRFRFYLKDGSLYSFWLSPWETGESRGFTAAGGPGLNPYGMDLPANYTLEN